MPEQRRVRYAGNVQGVGFRYTVHRIAGGYEVSGTVKNCPDGTVELVAEGEKAVLEAFLEDVRAQMGGYIRREQQQSAPASGQHQGFRIAF